jgi:phosphatidylserine decarboxylase
MLEIVLLFLIVRFFRYPDRTLTIDENAIYSPADGKIVIIEQKMEQKYFREERIQISIFMSVTNVHVNFYPVSGNIVMTDYFPGDKMVAWHPKSSDLNEHACVVVEDAKNRKILVKQIAGALARRIVCKAKKDEEVQQGNELGMIKFGSRVDISLPANARINVKMNQKVRAKETILAYFE